MQVYKRKEYTQVYNVIILLQEYFPYYHEGRQCMYVVYGIKTASRFALREGRYVRGHQDSAGTYPPCLSTLAKLDSISATTLARQFLPVLTTLLRS